MGIVTPTASMTGLKVVGGVGGGAGTGTLGCPKMGCAGGKGPCDRAGVRSASQQWGAARRPKVPLPEQRAAPQPEQPLEAAGLN